MKIYIDMYQFRGWAHGLPYISPLLLIKVEKLQEHDIF